MVICLAWTEYAYLSLIYGVFVLQLLLHLLDNNCCEIVLQLLGNYLCCNCYCIHCPDIDIFVVELGLLLHLLGIHW